MNTILFAAGASYGFFEPNISTTYLTEKICDKSEWDRIIAKYKEIVGPTIFVANADVVMNLIGIILKYRPDADFEEIAEVIDKLSSYSMDFRPDHAIINLFEATLHDFLNIQGNKLLGIGLQQIPFLLRQIIAEAIIDLDNNHKSAKYNELIKKQAEMVKYVCCGEEASVISTNYDDCVLQSLKDLNFTLGERIADNKHRVQIDAHDFMTAPKVVYFPHGHLRFQMTDNSEVTVWGNINDANARRWNGLKDFVDPKTNYVFTEKFAYNFNTFMTTGQTKDDAFNHMPYSLYYQRMAIDIAKSKNVVIIGYSFGDAHFNRLLNAYLSIDIEHNIFIVDKYDKEITMTLEGQDQSNILCKIQDVFKQHWLLKMNPTTHQYYPFYEEEVERLNHLGYGKIFPQVTFYKKGYVEFLNDYKEVVDENVL